MTTGATHGTDAGRSTAAPTGLRSAHIIVVGNEKGGSGKSTVAIHVAVALLKAGQRVATLDLDSRQQSLTHYIERRRTWSNAARLRLELPQHYHVVRGDGIRRDENEAVEFAGFAEAIAAVEQTHDFVVIDTPGGDSYLSRLAHAAADTLITPVNDSMLDLDVLGSVDPVSWRLTATSHYADLVDAARRERRRFDGRAADWIVMRNRLTPAPRNRRIITATLDALSVRLGFRFMDGFAERAVYREFFPCGVTAMDTVSAAILGARPSLSHLTAQQEVANLVAELRLPIDARGRHRAAARAEWAAASREPLDLHDLVVD
jgi:chromosome partitioning protein